MINQPKDGDTWSHWTLMKDNLTLEHREGEPDHPTLKGYGVDLERCRSSAEVLDWICQVASKMNVTAECVGSLVMGLNEILAPQANLCGMGSEQTDGGKKIRKVLQSIE